MQKYLITGGNGRFATELKKILKDKKNFIFFDKKNFDITDRKQISSVLNK
jgi:dTDP-4-dehydrorhamnose reductase